MAKIYLVRHAESIANTQGIYQGITYDTGLSIHGKEQATALADRFREIAIDTIVASPLRRTHETALYVSVAKRLSVCLEPSLKETNHGTWEGKSKQEIAERWPKLYRKWQRFPSRVAFPDGERFIDTQQRVLEWWSAFCKNCSGDTLVVSHDNIIRIIVGSVLNMKLNKIWRFHLQPTAVTKVEIAGGVAHIHSLNDMRHIAAMQVDLAVHAL